MAALICCKRKDRFGVCSKERGQRRPSDVDGPYALIIALASFLGHLLIYGVIFSSGVFYDMFREIFDGSSLMISLAATLSTAFTLGFSPVPGVLMNKYGQRIMTITGGVVAASGLILSAYATNAYYLAASFGVITGIGFGTAYLAVVSIVALYFDRYRSMAFGLVVSGVGLGTFVYPPVVRSLVHRFGARGSLLITGAFTLNLCVCGAVMRQPRRDRSGGGEGTIAASDGSGRTSKPSAGRRLPSTAKTSGCLSLFNLHIFKNAGYLILCVNNFLVLFGISIVYVHLTAYSETKGVDKDAAAMLISVVGIANFVGRPSFGLLGKLRCGPLMAYAVGLSLCGVGVLLIPLMTGLVGLMVLAAVFGFLSASIGPLIPQIVTDLLSVNLLPSAYGYLLVFEAAGSLSGPPAAGWMLDAIHKYPPSFYLGGATIGLSGIIMLIPFFIRRRPEEIDVDGLIEGDNNDTKKTFISNEV